MAVNGVVSFCVGTGRCGTTFVSELAGFETQVASSHERLRRAATFHMYCKWHDIAVDPEGFLGDRDRLVAQDLATNDVSFESSALLSHSIAELAERYDARFLLLVRNPHDTVASFAARGWFLEPIPWVDSSLPPTLPDAMEPRHFFGRNLPKGPELERWRGLTQIGKLAWFWRERNTAILEQLDALPSSRRMILRLEDLDYERYQRVARFLGWRVTMTPEAFEELASRRPNAGPNEPLDPATWDERSAQELEDEAGDLAVALGYEARTKRRVAGSSSRSRLQPPTIGRTLESLRCNALFSCVREMRTWSFRHPLDARLVEITWCADECEVAVGHSACRWRFSNPRALREHIEDWLEEVRLDGFVPSDVGVSAPVFGVRYSAIEARIRDELPSPAAWLVEGGRPRFRDILDVYDEVLRDEGDYDDLSPEGVPDYEVRASACLALDHAFEERIKEDPFDLDPLHRRACLLAPWVALESWTTFGDSHEGRP